VKRRSSKDSKCKNRSKVPIPDGGEWMQKRMAELYFPRHSGESRNPENRLDPGLRRDDLLPVKFPFIKSLKVIQILAHA
jgi:hypothetical protein